jgi:SAM-dependent methyltransferase
MMFANSTDSHAHSLQTLNLLYEYDDFMASIRSVVDLGCGTGQDTEWWATRTTRDDNQEPLLIRCTGVDLDQASPFRVKYPNLEYQSVNFEEDIVPFPGGYDVLWCHDSFQYARSPLQTLARWWHMASEGAMLYLCVPITQRIHRRQFDYYLPSGSYYHYSLVNLIYMLATTGWDCRSGFFRQSLGESWIHAAVYKSAQAPMDPKTITWYHLEELNLIPESGAKSILAHGHLNQQDLVLPWLDHSLMSMAIR